MPEATSHAGDGRRMLAALKLAVKDAWRVLSLLPDADARFRSPLGGGWCFQVVHEVHDAYGASPATSSARPAPQDITRMEIIMGWMSWLRRFNPNLGGGDFAVMRIMRWALGTPVWAIAQREGCSERTVGARIDKSLASVLLEFHQVSIEVDMVNERELRQARMRSSMEGQVVAPPTLDGADELEPGKVYIAGVGFMFHGKKYDPCGQLLERKGIRGYVGGRG